MIIPFIFAFLAGAFSVLLVQTFLLYKWWTSKEKDAPKIPVERSRVTNPKFVSDFLKGGSATKEESCMFLNLIFSFLWQEWRDKQKTKDFFMKRLNMEFTDLVTNRAAGKLIEQITILDVNLGTSLPVFKGATIMRIHPVKDPRDVPKELDIALDLEYTGGCHMTIQVDFPFNKTAYFSVKLVSLKGRGRLQFSTIPCTHWSFSFYQEPDMEFQAESHVEGKSIEQLTSLIINHLRRTISRKHTLPRYKIRYLPFFQKLQPQDEKQSIYVHDSLVTMGQLEVKVNGCTRLPDIEGSIGLYCALSVDALPWKQLAENSRALWTTFEVEITRENTTASFGMTLSKEYGGSDIDKVVFVETIIPSSPAELAGLQRGDVIVSVDGQRIDSLKQAAKMIKNKTRFTANFQRPPNKLQNKPDQHDGFDENAVGFKNVTVDSDENDSEEEFVNIMMPLFGDQTTETKSAMQNYLTKSAEIRQRSRKGQSNSIKPTSPKSPNPDTKKTMKFNPDTIRTRAVSPSQNADGTPEPNEVPQNKPVSPRSRGTGVKSKPSVSSEETSKSSLVIKPSTYCERPGTKKTKDVSPSQEPVWNECIKFDLGSKDLYLNVCVWSKHQEKNDKDILIGHITVPLMDVAVQCLALGERRHEQTYVLVSPHIDRIISSRPAFRGIPGLNESLCGGDMTLSFVHLASSQHCDDSALLEKMQELESLKAEEEESDLEDSLENSKPVEHNFILTQFYFPTRCNYCSKKIWTKVAYQCRNCALICHKKCLDSCRRFSSCLRSSNQKSRWFSKKPTEVKRDDISNEEQSEKKTPTDQKEAKTNETEENLQNEKQQNGHKKDENGQLLQEQEPTSEKTSDAITINESAVEQEKGEAVASDMVTASEQVKEMGRELFNNLPPEERKRKLQDMMARLQVEIDEENETQTDLYVAKKRTKDKKLKAHFVSLIGKSEERSQALAMLMLQYCAGLQDCADAEDEGCYEL